MDVSQLLQQCRAGDALAIETLVRTHQNAVYRLALSMLNDPAEADEAAQETFLAVLKSLPRYEGRAAFTTWLYAITVNVCRMQRRRRGAWARLQRRVGAIFQWTANTDAPEETAARRETETMVWAAVQRLGEKHRLPIVLRYYFDCSVEEIARILELNEGTVHSRLSTARDRLRIALSASAMSSETSRRVP